MRASVIIPIYREASIIPELQPRLEENVARITPDYEMIYVLDGCQDNSYEVVTGLAARNPHVRFIRLSRNFGHQIAVSAGLDHCSGDVVIIIDGDLQDPPELIPDLYAKYQEGYKVVYAQRVYRKGESYFKKLTAKLFYRILKRIASADIPLDTGDFRLIDKTIVMHLRRMPERNKFLRGQIAWLGYKQAFVPYIREPRKNGKGGYTLRKLFSLAFDGITGFSDFPLRLATTLGFVFSVVAMLIIVYALLSYFMHDKIAPGWTSVMVSTMFIGGIQLLAIGMIGEYISRIISNIRQRPLYVIDETNLTDAPSSPAEVPAPVVK